MSQKYSLYVPFLIESIKEHNQLVDHTINLICTAYGGIELGGVYEMFGDPEKKDPGPAHVNHELDECTVCADFMSLQGRTMDFEFNDKDKADAAGRACDLMMDTIGCYVVAFEEDGEVYEDNKPKGGYVN